MKWAGAMQRVEEEYWRCGWSERPYGEQFGRVHLAQ